MVNKDECIKVKGIGNDIAVRNRNHHTTIRESHAIRDHTVLPVTRQRRLSRFYASRNCQLVLDLATQEDARLS